MILRAPVALLALSTLFAGSDVRAADITRGGRPAELTVAAGGAHGVRVTLRPVDRALPPSPSLLSLEISNPAVRLRTLEKPAQARVGALDVEVSSAPLKVVVQRVDGRVVQELV